MATQTPRRDNLHGEEDVTPRFTGEHSSLGYDDQTTPAGKSSDPRGDDGTPKRNQVAPAGDPSDPRGDGLSRGDLGRKESAAGSGASTAMGSGEKSLADRFTGSEDGFYRQEKPSRFSMFKGRISKKVKRRIAVTATASAIGLGGLIGLNSGSGPLALMQFGEGLKRPLIQRTDEDNSRVVKVGRYIYHLQRGGNVQNVRLGYFANKYADSIEKKMNKSGFETAYTEKYGFRAGYVIDPDKLPDTDLERYKKLDPKGNLDIDATQRSIQAHIEREFGVRANILSDGRIFLDTKELDGKVRQSRALDKIVIRASGYSGSATVLNGHIMAKRAGITLHPIKKLDRKLNMKAEERYAKWREDQAAKNKGEVNARGTVSSGADEDSPDKAGTDAAAEEGNSTIEEGKQASDGDSGAIERFQNSTKAKVAAGGASLVGVACVIKALDDSSDAIKETEVIKVSMRIAASFISVIDQLRTGDDLDMEQVGFFAKQLHGKDSSGNESSVGEASTQRAEFNKKGGVQPVETLTTIDKGSPFAFINAGAVGTFTGAACSTAGIVAATVVGIATGGVASSVVSGILSAALAPVIMDQMADWIAGNALDPMPVGADLANTGYFGSALMAKYQGASSGGREQDSTETALYRQYLDEEHKKELQTKSFAYRVFSLEDQRTVASQLLSSGIVSDNYIIGAVSDPAKTFGAVIGQFASLVVPSVSAASDPDIEKNKVSSYIKDTGFSIQELANAKVENPFQNAEEVTSRILPAHPEYIDRAKTCFGVGVDSSTYDITSLNASSPSYKDMSKDECKDKSEDFLQFRMYIKDTQLMTSLACYEGDTEACGQIEVETVSDSSEESPATIGGTAQELAQQILENDNINIDSGSFCRYCLEDIKNTAEGKPAYGNVKLDVGLLKFLAELGEATPIDVNSISGAGSGHSSGSNHYSGKAVDFECGFDEAKADEIGKKYGYMANNERCDQGVNHSHYSPDGY